MTRAQSSLPSMPFNVRAAEDALCAVVVTTSGLGADRVEWLDMRRPISDYPFARMQWLTDTPRGFVSRDVVELDGPPAAPAPNLHQSFDQLSEVVFQLDFYSLANDPEGGARTRASACRIGLYRTDMLDALRAAGLAVKDVGAMQMLPSSVGGDATEQRATFDLTCFVVQSAFADVPSIETVDVTATVDGVTLPTFTAPAQE